MFVGVIDSKGTGVSRKTLSILSLFLRRAFDAALEMEDFDVGMFPMRRFRLAFMSSVETLPISA